MKDLYVVNCCRTAIGSFGGSLKNTPAAEMGAVVVKEALKRANIAPENVDEVMFGCILTAAQGQNVARQVAIKAGIPYSVPAYTVGMVCGSGMKSVIEGARSILAGDSDVVVCGGTENMSAAPFASMDARWGARMGDKKLVDTMIKDGLWDAYNNYHMGTTAENICDVWGITREELDAFGAASQQKTEAAQAAGADYVGGQDLVDKITKENWMDFDVVIASPDMMGLVGRLGKILGPRGLMPSPKAGTVTPDVVKAVQEAKAGKIEYRLDKTNIIHCPIGKASFGADKLVQNFETLMEAIVKAKPSAAKGTYLKSCTVTSTMGVGVKVATNKYGV